MISWQDVKDLDPGDVFFAGLKLGASALLASLLFHFLANRLPNAASIQPPVLSEPKQTTIENTASIEVQRAGHSYRMHPQAQYSLSGLVVALHDASSWLDISHAKWGDFFNSHDVCLVWGDLAISQYLRDYDFSHGDWTCYVKTRNGEAWRAFQKNQISNTHVLPADENITRFFSSLRIGDQIHLTGRLVDYAIDGGPLRKTSLVRTDEENGACEILYTESASFLYRGPWVFRFFETVSFLAMGAGVLLMIFAFFILPLLKKAEVG